MQNKTRSKKTMARTYAKLIVKTAQLGLTSKKISKNMLACTGVVPTNDKDITYKVIFNVAKQEARVTTKNFNDLSYKQKMILVNKALADISSTQKVDIDLKKDVFEDLTSDFSLLDGTIIFHDVDKEINDIKCLFSSNKGSISSSMISANIEGLKTNIKLSGNLINFVANAEIKGFTKKILNHSFDDQINSVLTFKKKKDGGYFSGVAQITDNPNTENQQQENIFFGVNFKNIFRLTFREAISSGWFRAEKILLDKWAELLPKQEVKLSGRANILSFFQQDKLSLHLQAQDFKFENTSTIIFIFEENSSEDKYL
jgi:hypothetical protein